VQRPTVYATAAEPMSSPPHKRSFLRVRLAREGTGWVASPTGAQGSHVITSIARADGLAVIPENVTQVAPGDEVRVQLLVDG
jgi:molybdopterin molybdotransferase